MVGDTEDAGEILTLEMMKEWIRIFKSVDFTYTRYQALDTFGFSTSLTQVTN